MNLREAKRRAWRVAHELFDQAMATDEVCEIADYWGMSRADQLRMDKAFEDVEQYLFERGYAAVVVDV